MSNVLNRESPAYPGISAVPKGLWKFGQGLVLGVRALWPLHVGVMVYVLAVQFWLGRVVVSFSAIRGAMGTVFLGLTVLFVVFIVGRFFWYVLVARPASPARQLLKDIRETWGNPARLLTFILLFPAFSLFAQAFAAFKGMIAHTHPFEWDETFMQLDKALHGGTHPWEWLYPLLQSLPATWIINFVYNLWFIFLITSILWVVFQRRLNELPLQYFIAFFLAWSLGGSLLAWYFSSAGPAFYHHLGLPSDPYAPLRDHLERLHESATLWAVETQKTLWEDYLTQDTSLGGISAFPSMHNAQATLLALLAWRLGRLPGLLMTLNAVFIVIGSVWLGWHYAVDSYAGIVIGILCWWIARPLARLLLHRPVMREFIRLQRLLDTQRGTCGR